MKLHIPKDYFDNPTPPQIFLCTPGGKIIGELPAYEASLDGKWNAYSELSFSIDRQYVDVITGKTKINPLFDKAEGLRKVLVKNIGYFVIQDPDASYSDKDSKTLTCFSSEYETSSKYLENFRINTGEIDSKEVIYQESIYGENYTIDDDNLYKLANMGEYSPYDSYYIREYTDKDSYTYEQIQIQDEADYNAHFVGSESGIPLYVTNYPNVQFYNKVNPKLSLLHLIFEKIPEWSIGNVDTTLWRKERKFDEDRIAVYDFLMNEVSETFKCVVEWDTINKKVNFYEEAEDGITEDNTVQTRWDTDIFISRDNLASEITINYSTDDIKTKLKVSGSDDLDIREVNLGKNYIMNLDYYHNSEWMEDDLFYAYQNYLDTCEEWAEPYREAVKGRVASYNRWNDLMHAVPATNDVVLIGDEFKKLYCIYTRKSAYSSGKFDKDTSPGNYTKLAFIDNQYQNLIDVETLFDGEQLIIQDANKEYFLFQYEESKFKQGLEAFKCIRYLGTDALQEALKEQLRLYHVNEDTKGNNTDNILLKLTNSNNDVATIRIYNDGSVTSPLYRIRTTIVYANGGTYDSSDNNADKGLRPWILGELTAKELKLEGYKVSYIGTMGAYFVLAKDETHKPVLQNYGIKLLQEKHNTYVKIFQTQTEAMLSQEKYQCIVQNELPDGSYDNGTRWLDTNSSPVKLYEYSGAGWKEISGQVSEIDQSNYENYQRYIDNYEKLQAIQEVLVEKETLAEYMLNGYVVSDNRIDISLYERIDGVLKRDNNGSTQTLEEDMRRCALVHFDNDPTIIGYLSDEEMPMYTFTTAKYPDEVFNVYIKGTTPYIAFEKSVGVWQTKMDYINQLTDFESFFTEEQWIELSPFIREDEFSDDNFLFTGYESEEERIEICTELMESADKELKTLSQPSLEFSMEMANILALPEFKSLTEQFQLGNFIRVHIRDGYTKRARLLEVHLNFDDLSDFSAAFGNLITTKSEIDKHADLLAQAVTAGKQVAKAAGDWQRAVDVSNKLEEDIANGLADATLEVGKASGQSIVWDSSGIWGRKLKDGTTDQYEDEQFRIINNKLVFSNDGFRTSKAVFGKYVVDGEERWGPLSEYITADIIEGKFLKGGSIQIGDGTVENGNLFIVNEDGSVEIRSNGQEKYAVKSAMDEIQQAYRYRIELEYIGSTIFTDQNQECEVKCKIYDTKVANYITPSRATYEWLKNGASFGKPSSSTIKIKPGDIDKNAQISCAVTFDESQT